MSLDFDKLLESGALALFLLVRFAILLVMFAILGFFAIGLYPWGTVAVGVLLGTWALLYFCGKPL